MTISLRGVSVLLFIAMAARGPRTAAAAGDPLLQLPDTLSWQVHAMLTAAGQDTGDTDLFLVVPDIVGPSPA